MPLRMNGLSRLNRSIAAATVPIVALVCFARLLLEYAQGRRQGRSPPGPAMIPITTMISISVKPGLE